MTPVQRISGKQLFAIIIATTVAMAWSEAALAKNYSVLVGDGYKPGSMTRNKAGSQGWIFKKGSNSYFCKLKSATTIVDSSKMAVFTTAGRISYLDRKTFEKKTGPAEGKYPKLADLKAGRVTAANVGACSPM